MDSAILRNGTTLPDRDARLAACEFLVELHWRHCDAAQGAEKVVEVAPQSIEELRKIPLGPDIGRIAGDERGAVIAEREHPLPVSPSVWGRTAKACLRAR